MNVQTIRPPCTFHHPACPCGEWERLKVLNELNQLQKQFNELEKNYIDLVKAISQQIEVDT